MEALHCRIIAHIYNDYTGKFGIPRQSGLAQVPSVIVFTPTFRNPDALRGLEGYSHLWLLWHFSEAVRQGGEKGEWSPTVRPPKLGGNTRMGVFATRSPFRPNPIGLSSVQLLSIEPDTPRGPLLHVSGADLMNGTPILDIKPYLPYTDAHPEAASGFAREEASLEVAFPPHLLARIPAEKHTGLLDALAEDPRPAYQQDPARIYAMPFGRWTIWFRVEKDLLTVTDVTAEK